jgi:hypothetical protein
VISRAAEQVYRLLPDYVQAADPGTDWTVRRYIAAAATGLDPAVDLLHAIDPDTSVTGTCEIVNPDAAPRSFLPWLGWLVGIDTTALADADVRGVLRDAVTSQRRGSVLAMAAAVRRTLTGSQDVTILTKPPDPDYPAWDYNQASEDYNADVRRFDGGITDPWLIIVVTKTAQTPDSTATLLAAEGEKPAGVLLELQTLAGMTYTELAAAYATYDVMRATNRTYGNLATSFA